MKYAIVFSSQTGNTKQLAEVVSSVLPQADLCFFGSPSQEALQAERLFIGFWTDKGRCNQEITDFLKTLNGKEVFLFGTAGFGGSQEYFDKILSSVQKHLGASNTVIGTYMCQGKMPQSVKERYLSMKRQPEQSYQKGQASYPDSILSIHIKFFQIVHIFHFLNIL